MLDFIDLFMKITLNINDAGKILDNSLISIKLIAKDIIIITIIKRVKNSMINDLYMEKL